MNPHKSCFQKILFKLLLNLHAKSRSEGGYIIVIVAGMIVAISAMLLTGEIVSRVDNNSTKSSGKSTAGFYAAEAGLNLRAKAIKAKFIGYNLPQGTSPSSSAICAAGSGGTGDFACDNTLTVQDYLYPNDATKRIPVSTYVVDQNLPYVNNLPSPKSTTISSGTYAGLNAQEYIYDVTSVAYDRNTLQPTASLGIRFKSQLIPLFQFAAFYGGTNPAQDLDYFVPPNMTMNGPIHANGNIYLDASSGATLQLNGNLTMTGNLYRGERLSPTTCSGTVNIFTSSLPCVGSSTSQYSQATLNQTWTSSQIQTGMKDLASPPISSFNSDSTGTYWNSAQLRVVLNVDASNNPTGIQVQTASGGVDTSATNNLLGTTCASQTVQGSKTFWNYREKNVPANQQVYDAKLITLLQVDVQKLMSCANQLMGGKNINDITNGGLVWFLTVKGPNPVTNVTTGGNPSTYGVRLDNGSKLASTTAGDPAIQGLTIVSDQAIYIRGDYNSINKKPASIMADTINVLSNSWPADNYASTMPTPKSYTVSGISFNAPDNSNSSKPWNASNRTASNTTINAAFLAGIDPSGGGLNNYPRFQENWSGQTLTYRGSMVSLGIPQRVNSLYCGSLSTNPNCNIYSPPVRNWDYDTDFNNAALLPPLTPRAVNLQQERFTRDYTRTSFLPQISPFASILPSSLMSMLPSTIATSFRF